MDSVTQTFATTITVDRAAFTAPTRQHELDHTAHTDHTVQVYLYPEKTR